MRIAARTSSGEGGAPADFPMLRDHLAAWKVRLAETGWTPWLILGLAVFLRFFLLGIKPPHFDEGINGWFVDQMMKNGFYKYDPTNYHGPLHFYVL
jgi:predicted membrane-bound mannosyltransferase